MEAYAEEQMRQWEAKVEAAVPVPVRTREGGREGRREE